MAERTTQEELLTAIRDRLRSRISEYNESNCFVSDQVVPAIFPSGTYCCTVSVGDGTFPDEFFAGGGHVTLTEHCPLQITAFIRISSDKPPQAQEQLLGTHRGLVSRFKRRILGVLLCEEKDGAVGAWKPCNADGNEILRDQLAPTSCSAPTPTADGQMLSMILRFSMVFDWLLE